MKLIIGGVCKDYPTETRVTQLIEAEKLEMPEYVTVSVNDEFIEREKFDVTILKDGDNIEFLYFMGGGGNGVYR